MVLAYAFWSGCAALGAALGYRAIRQRQNRRLAEMTSANKIEEKGFVTIGGIPQWVTIRGDDRQNPVLLILHGGPGAALSTLSYALFRPVEGVFTVAHWDQRGAGRTFGRNGKRRCGEMSIARMANDAIEVAEYLCKRLGKAKIVVCGVSWGSVLGSEIVKRRPDLFAAYVATGQIVDMRRGEQFAYDRVLERARAAGDQKAISALEEIGEPPYRFGKARRVWQRWLLAYSGPAERRAVWQMPWLLLFAPHTSLRDVWNMGRGVIFNLTSLFEALMTYNVMRLGSRFETPMFFFHGADDLQTPTKLVQDYFATLQAPMKELVLLEGAGHLAIRSTATRFLEELVARVRPLACDASAERFASRRS
jgi:pimeloyl-ACP methyl ester carboxylesterase